LSAISYSLGVCPCRGGVEFLDKKKPFDLNQKAYHMSSDLQEI